ncbi:ribosome biogenesis GTPase Der [Candidatus Uhrbacteria bacterium RIFCSPHIGHO2_01_FULL_63_20]|uniref:GTPase Der n=1 Tax=Candidatus Uhrbacteria bacterium RIFCSPHIGHO2_01_FULL_63_20 TaxID=1802385 RepID=A0A1F7TNR6_9BACT|nr:MAG: ribosome biogenesis GTPase Der [Candidatus Uhrbacteria bacterium RIFCSPHIGHO2_01_FULL_63_20]
MALPSSVPSLALVGRTNVGKSTLFNRLTESHKAIVSDVAGTTRDRLEGECLWRGKVVKVIDTGGLDVEQVSVIEKDVIRQAEKAMKMADVILVVLDAKVGPLPQDRELVTRLRQSGKEVLLVANKAEGVSTVNDVLNGKDWRLSGYLPHPVSAVKGTGSGDLLDEAYKLLEKIDRPPAEISQVKPVRVAVIGQPNVGKSSLLNSILGEERFIVSPIAHTTRDPNDVMVEIGDRSYVLVDTAGMRKAHKMREKGGLERASVERARKLLNRTDIVLFVLDASEPIAAQERTLAGMLSEAKVGVIVVVNKWDLVADKTPSTTAEYTRMLHRQLPFLAWAPVVFVSAKTAKRVSELFDLIDQVETHRHMTVTEEELSAFLTMATRRHLPARGKGPSHPKVLGLVQTDVAPPTFHLTIKSKQTDVLHPSYLRYLENRLREHFDFLGSPIEIRVKVATAVSLRK